MYELNEQRRENVDLLIQYVNTFAGCKATPHTSNKLLIVKSICGHEEIIPATLNDVQDWLRA